jgi:hypothetical protein
LIIPFLLWLRCSSVHGNLRAVQMAMSVYRAVHVTCAIVGIVNGSYRLLCLVSPADATENRCPIDKAQDVLRDFLRASSSPSHTPSTFSFPRVSLVCAQVAVVFRMQESLLATRSPRLHGCISNMAEKSAFSCTNRRALHDKLHKALLCKVKY